MKEKDDFEGLMMEIRIFSDSSNIGKLIEALRESNPCFFKINRSAEDGSELDEESFSRFMNSFLNVIGPMLSDKEVGVSLNIAHFKPRHEHEIQRSDTVH